MTKSNNKTDDLKKRIQALKLLSPLENWEFYATQAWFGDFIAAEEEARNRKNYKRRMALANLNEFKPISEFDWSWPKEIDKTAIMELLSLEFLREKENIVFIGDNGTGKTMLAKNIGFEALTQGLNVVSVTAASMLTTLSRYESNGMFGRGLARYAKPDLLLIDELGQISFGERHADLLFAVVSARYLKKSTIIITNTRFKQWNELFPNATSVATIIDRLIHRSEIIEIIGDSYRIKESLERQNAKRNRRTKSKNSSGG